MASNLSPLGTLSYAGVPFNVYTGSTVNVRPVYSQDGRTTVHNQYVFVIKTIIHGSPTDSEVTNARRALTKNGAAFVYRDRGLGDISVNVGSVKDVAWGPKPKELAFRYVGADHAVELTFQLEVAIPDCSAARYTFAPAELSYEVSFDIDRAGWTRMTYAGFVRIPLTRRAPGDRSVPDSADYYRELIYPRPIAGFRMVPGTFTLSADRTTLHFTFSYEKMGLNAPPPGVVDVQADFRLNTTGAALTIWHATLNASYEMAVNGDRGVASKHFTALTVHYMDKSREQIRARGAAGGFPIPTAYSVAEPEIYGRPRAEFSCGWRFASDLANILRRSGLWEPVPNSDWLRWAFSMRGVLGARGVDGIQFDVSRERVTDLCAPVVSLPTVRTRTAELRGRPGNFAELVSCPPPERSWLDYRCWLETEADQGIAELRTLPETLIEPPKDKGAELRSAGSGGTGGPTISGNLRDIQPDAGKIPGYVGGGPGVVPPAVVEQRAAPLVVVYLVGWAMRACYTIPVPHLSRINGKPVVPANRLDKGEKFYGPVLAANFGVPVYYARWRLRFLIPEVPAGNVPVPANPVL